MYNNKKQKQLLIKKKIETLIYLLSIYIQTTTYATMSSERKIVRVSYTVDDVFKIPKGLDLEDKTQVKFWGVKYNTLYITKVDGTELNIDSEGWISHFDYKYPSNDAEIIDADDVGLDDEEDKCDCCGENANAGLIDGKFMCISCREEN